MCIRDSVETVKTRKKREKTGGKWARYGLKGVKESGSPVRALQPQPLRHHAAAQVHHRLPSVAEVDGAVAAFQLGVCLLDDGDPTLLTHYFSANFRPFCAVFSPFFRGFRLPGAKTERTGEKWRKMGEIWGRNGREIAVAK